MMHFVFLRIPKVNLRVHQQFQDFWQIIYTLYWNHSGNSKPISCKPRKYYFYCKQQWYLKTKPRRIKSPIIQKRTLKFLLCHFKPQLAKLLPKNGKGKLGEKIQYRIWTQQGILQYAYCVSLVFQGCISSTVCWEGGGDTAGVTPRASQSIHAA